MACHNYCDPPHIMPRGIPQLLGLGLKICIRKPRPNSKKLIQSTERFNNEVHRKSYFKLNPPEDDGEVRYIAGLYIKSDTEWRPSEIPEVEESLEAFEIALRDQQARPTFAPGNGNSPGLSKLMTNLSSSKLTKILVAASSSEKIIFSEASPSI